MIESQLNDLQNADVLVLNEADWGMKRTEYRDVTRELAAALHMNYAYGVEFVEVDPVFALGIEQVHLPDAEQDARLQEDLRVDREQYRGLHGTAILSRYPIQNAHIFACPSAMTGTGRNSRRPPSWRRAADGPRTNYSGSESSERFAMAGEWP